METKINDNDDDKDRHKRRTINTLRKKIRNSKQKEIIDINTPASTPSKSLTLQR